MCNDVVKKVKICNVGTLLETILSCLDEPQRSSSSDISLLSILYLIQGHNATCVKITLEHKKAYLII